VDGRAGADNCRRSPDWP